MAFKNFLIGVMTGILSFVIFTLSFDFLYKSKIFGSDTVFLIFLLFAIFCLALCLYLIKSEKTSAHVLIVWILTVVGAFAGFLLGDELRR